MATTADPHKPSHDDPQEDPLPSARRSRAHHRTDYDDGIGLDSSESEEGAPKDLHVKDESEALDPHNPRMWERIKRLRGMLGGEGVDQEELSEDEEGETTEDKSTDQSSQHPTRPETGERRISRRAIAGLPRPATFKRQMSEKREKLLPHERGAVERRIASSGEVTRSRATTTSAGHAPPPSFQVEPKSSDCAIFPTVLPPSDHPPPFSTLPIASNALDQPSGAELENALTRDLSTPALAQQLDGAHSTLSDHASPFDPPPPFSSHASRPATPHSRSPSISSTSSSVLASELSSTWILNLSMHFRDRSQREKFFITYFRDPSFARRVTISLDYRSPPPASLESDLSSLRFQRDKSLRIYESVRSSLPDIQFYPTVTNLKLQTLDGRLHVHVTEDVHEIIPYPPIAAAAHLVCPHFCEGELALEAHLSGYVYRVWGPDAVPSLVKKEIPGPDSVDEFLYELNALSALSSEASPSSAVIPFRGLVTSPDGMLITGLLIAYASQGALIDLLYDHRDGPLLPLARRLRWARQITAGLAQVHEAGFVQGDFTLSNVVVDDADDAKIIDINRRGCPVGWEPPEMGGMIESGMRVGLFIGVKSDLWQLGMVLWALGEAEEAPETMGRPLIERWSDADGARETVPSWYRDIVAICLSERPEDRQSARDLAALSGWDNIDDSAAQPVIATTEPPRSHTPRPTLNEKSTTRNDRTSSTEETPPPTYEAVPTSHPSSIHRGRSGPSHSYFSTATLSPNNTGVPALTADDSLPTESTHPDIDAPFNEDDTPRDTRAATVAAPGLSPGQTSLAQSSAALRHDTTHTTELNLQELDEPSAQIISVSPADSRWEEVNVQGHPYLIDRSSVDLWDPVSKAVDSNDHHNVMGEVSAIKGEVEGSPESEPGKENSTIADRGGDEIGDATEDGKLEVAGKSEQATEAGPERQQAEGIDR